MSEFLITHALNNVWCNPDQDNQLVFEPNRISKRIGETNRMRFMNRYLQLPTLHSYYHVFQIGQLYPTVIGLLDRNPTWTLEKWYSFESVINELNVFVDIYNQYGVQLPRFKCHYMMTNERALVFAFEQIGQMPVDYNNDRFYVRLYSNSFFNSPRFMDGIDYLHNQGTVLQTSVDLTNFQQIYLSYVSKKGKTTAYVNGLKVQGIDLVNAKPGDVAEIYYDSSVKKVMSFTVDQLYSFNSTLDNKLKYLIRMPKETNDTIDYFDDVDFYIYFDQPGIKHTGLYYHKNAKDSVRMITHNDYSITVDYFVFIANRLKEIIGDPAIDLRSLKIEVRVRESGYVRPLVSENNRIFELYKLDDELITNALTGLNSNFQEWKAEVLEASGYTELMRVNSDKVNMELIQRAYGYNTLSKLLGDSPIKTRLQSGLQYVDLPEQIANDCTVYEYDANGHLLGYYHNTSTPYYYTNNQLTRLVEVIAGHGTNKPHTVFGTNNLAMIPFVGYRVYRSRLINGISDNIWDDITESDLYSVSNNVLTWEGTDNDQYIMVRFDNSFLAQTFNISSINGNVSFTLTEVENRTGIDNNYILPVPLGELDIFLNNKSLIRGLDYIIVFPKVYIISKQFIRQFIDTEQQEIHVRFTGYCKSNLDYDDLDDYGFVEHGLLSNNNRFDLRDDKVLRITINGATRHKDDLLFSEEHSGISVTNPLNGKPYQIKDMIVPIKGLVNESTYSLRSKSLDIDKRLSDYMTLRLPQPPRSNMLAITNRYQVFSPFLCSLIFHLNNNLLATEIFTQPLSDIQILEICKPFEHLLAFDPITYPERFDKRYIIIVPHSLNNVINIDLYKYRFLNRVVKLYCDGLVELSPFVSLSS